MGAIGAGLRPPLATISYYLCNYRRPAKLLAKAAADGSMALARGRSLWKCALTVHILSGQWEPTRQHGALPCRGAEAQAKFTTHESKHI